MVSDKSFALSHQLVKRLLLAIKIEQYMQVIGHDDIANDLCVCLDIAEPPVYLVICLALSKQGKPSIACKGYEIYSLLFLVCLMCGHWLYVSDALSLRVLPCSDPEGFRDK